MTQTAFDGGELDERPSFRLNSTISTWSGKSIEIRFERFYKQSQKILLESYFVGFLDEPVEFKCLSAYSCC